MMCDILFENNLRGLTRSSVSLSALLLYHGFQHWSTCDIYFLHYERTLTKYTLKPDGFSI